MTQDQGPNIKEQIGLLVKGYAPEALASELIAVQYELRATQEQAERLAAALSDVTSCRLDNRKCAGGSGYACCEAKAALAAHTAFKEQSK